MTEPQYQISREHEFGRWLMAIAQGNVVEIGMFWGLGSTACLMEGIANNGGKLWTVEQSAKHVAFARDLWRDRDDIEIVHGHTVHVVKQLPDWIDLLLLDGGEWSSDHDFDLLNQRCVRIALDDTMRRKNQRQRKILKESRDWDILVDNTRERNGFLIACRK